MLLRYCPTQYKKTPRISKDGRNHVQAQGENPRRRGREFGGDDQAGSRFLEGAPSGGGPHFPRPLTKLPAVLLFPFKSGFKDSGDDFLRHVFWVNKKVNRSLAIRLGLGGAGDGKRVHPFPQ
jgi:hypothetical protein